MNEIERNTVKGYIAMATSCIRNIMSGVWVSGFFQDIPKGEKNR
ncbi:hypothetical protein [Oxalobacter paeniformigenes]|nr:hypothetical protein [Oxalobacter paeniformigenes]